jgi:hypothetical protein
MNRNMRPRGPEPGGQPPLLGFLSWFLTVVAAIGGGVQIAGVQSLSLAIFTIVAGLLGAVIGVWYSRWISYTGRYKPAIFAGVFLVVGLTAVAVSFRIVQAKEAQDLKEPEGLLIPASDPVPDNDCIRSFRQRGLAANSYFVLFGQSTAVFNRFPHNVLSIDTTPVLWLTQDKAGHIGANLDVTESGILMTRIRDNHFIVNPGAVFHFERADRSTLDVVDQHGTQVLHIRFMNPETISVNGLIGRFFIPPYQPQQPTFTCTAYSVGSDILSTTH